MTTDHINHPPHYTHGAIEPIEVIEAWNLPFHLGNVIKYIARHEHKGATLDDIKKAELYLSRYRALLEDVAFDRASNVRAFIDDDEFAQLSRVEIGLRELAAFDVSDGGGE